jgi:transposase InsO family protein
MTDLVASCGMSKQNFYQRLTRMNCLKDEQAGILHIVEQARKDHPKMAIRELYRMIQPETIGRDRFEKLCMESGYGVRRKKNYRQTTDSRGVTRFPNLVKDIKLTGVNQVFVSDITYYEMGGRFNYLTFIMDLYNREIVGSSVSNNLRTESTTIPALHQLIKLRGSDNLKGAVFHSDGGGQYYSKEFKTLTGSLGMKNSMTQEKVSENPHAERLNGVIKNNYLYPYGPSNTRELNKYLKKAVWMYNNEKPHKALKHMTPIQFKKQVNHLIN